MRSAGAFALYNKELVKLTPIVSSLFVHMCFVQLFCTRFRFSFFWHKEIGKTATCEILVKLTAGFEDD